MYKKYKGEKNIYNIIGGLIIVLVMNLTGCGTYDDTYLNREEYAPIEIEFWYGLSGNQESVMEQMIEEFNNSQERVHVRGITQANYNETSHAFRQAIADRNPPEVVLLEDQDMHKFVGINQLSTIDDLILDEIEFNSEDIVIPFMEQCVVNNNTYALPIYGTTQVLYYRKDLFKQSNLDPRILDTWEGLERAAQILKKENNGEIVVYGWEPMQGRENLIDAAINKGAKFLSDDGREVLIDSDEWIDTWNTFRKWIHEDKIMKINYGGLGWQYWYATIDDVMQGRAAGYTGSIGDSLDLDFSIIGARIQPYWEGYEKNPRAVFNSHVICIPKDIESERRIASFEWMKYITSTEISAKWGTLTGYMPVRYSSVNTSLYKDYMKQNPYGNIAWEQLQVSRNIFSDPTFGVIFDSLKEAAEKVEVYNISAEIALKEAKEKSQKALDEVNN